MPLVLEAAREAYRNNTSGRYNPIPTQQQRKKPRYGERHGRLTTHERKFLVKFAFDVLDPGLTGKIDARKLKDISDELGYLIRSCQTTEQRERQIFIATLGAQTLKSIEDEERHAFQHSVDLGDDTDQNEEDDGVNNDDDEGDDDSDFIAPEDDDEEQAAHKRIMFHQPKVASSFSSHRVPGYDVRFPDPVLEGESDDEKNPDATITDEDRAAEEEQYISPCPTMRTTNEQEGELECARKSLRAPMLKLGANINMPKKRSRFPQHKTHDEALSMYSKLREESHAQKAVEYAKRKCRQRKRVQMSEEEEDQPPDAVDDDDDRGDDKSSQTQPLNPAPTNCYQMDERSRSASSESIQQ